MTSPNLAPLVPLIRCTSNPPCTERGLPGCWYCREHAKANTPKGKAKKR